MLALTSPQLHLWPLGYFDLCTLTFSSPAPPPPGPPVHRFAGRTVTSGSLVLVTVATKEGGPSQLTVNCEKMVIGTMLVKDILLALTQWPHSHMTPATPPLTPTLCTVTPPADPVTLQSHDPGHPSSHPYPTYHNTTYTVVLPLEVVSVWINPSYLLFDLFSLFRSPLYLGFVKQL